MLRLATLWYLGHVSRTFVEERGQRLAVYANDTIGHRIDVDGVYERDDLETLIAFLAPLGWWGDGPTRSALDVGANIGNHSIYFARYFSRVLAFEPDQLTFQLLQFNTQFDPNIETYNIGLSDAPGTLDFFVDDQNYGASSAVYMEGKPSTRAVAGKLPTSSIDVIALDDSGLDLSNIGLIKIDVEGMEHAVLAGAMHTIKANEPIIVFEQHKIDFDNAQDGTKSTRLLQQLGYRFAWIEVGTRAQATSAIRGLFNVVGLAGGKTTRVVLDAQIPRRWHPMLIALPPAVFAELVEQRVVGRPTEARSPWQRKPPAGLEGANEARERRSR